MSLIICCCLSPGAFTPGDFMFLKAVKGKAFLPDSNAKSLIFPGTKDSSDI